MVKVVEKSLEERAREEKINTLARITNELLGTDAVENGMTGFDLFIHEKIHVSILCENKIIIPEEKYFDTAMRLAEAYEKVTGSEWIVKKNY